MTKEELENGTFTAAWAELAESNVSFIVPAKNYDIRNDERILIPFFKSVKIGFVNRQGEIVVEPKFDVVRGNCLSEIDFIHVGFNYSYAFERKNGEPATYNRTKWGLIDFKGEYVLEPQYSAIIVNATSIIVRRAYGRDYDGSHALLNMNGEEIVPFGVYWDIEPFQNGLARCRNHRMEGGKRIELCGVINEQGDVLLECNDRHIMPFYGRYCNRYLSSLKDILYKENPRAAREYFPLTTIDIASGLSKLDERQEQFEKELQDDAKAVNAIQTIQDSQSLYIDACLNNNIKDKTTYGDISVVTLKGGMMGVFKLGNCIVPFGKYGWIDGFDNGLARVRSCGRTTYTKNTVAVIDLENNNMIQGADAIEQHVKKEFAENPDSFAKWGIINEEGKEVLPLIYDEVWNFYGKGRSNTKAVRNGVEYEISLRALSSQQESSGSSRDDYEDDYGTHYGEYAGTYAQDVAGYSDDVINDAFDGEADAYWNID